MDRQARRRLFLVILACAVVAVTLAFVPYVRETVYIGRLSSEDSDTRCSALRMLGEMRSVRAVADVVRCATKDADMEVRVTAGWALADIGEPALPRLLHTLESGGPDDRAEAARTLVQVVTRNRSPTAMQPLARALKDPDAFPHADLGLLRAFDVPGRDRIKPAELKDRAEMWRPWRAYAALLLWSSDANSGG